MDSKVELGARASEIKTTASSNWSEIGNQFFPGLLSSSMAPEMVATPTFPALSISQEALATMRDRVVAASAAKDARLGSELQGVADPLHSLMRRDRVKRGKTRESSFMRDVLTVYGNAFPAPFAELVDRPDETRDRVVFIYAPHETMAWSFLMGARAVVAEGGIGFFAEMFPRSIEAVRSDLVDRSANPLHADFMQETEGVRDAGFLRPFFSGNPKELNAHVAAAVIAGVTEASWSGDTHATQAVAKQAVPILEKIDGTDVPLELATVSSRESMQLRSETSRLAKTTGESYADIVRLLHQMSEMRRLGRSLKNFYGDDSEKANQALAVVSLLPGINHSIFQSIHRQEGGKIPTVIGRPTLQVIISELEEIFGGKLLPPATGETFASNLRHEQMHAALNRAVGKSPAQQDSALQHAHKLKEESLIEAMRIILGDRAIVQQGVYYRRNRDFVEQTVKALTPLMPEERLAYIRANVNPAQAK